MGRSRVECTYISYISYIECTYIYTHIHTHSCMYIITIYIFIMYIIHKLKYILISAVLAINGE